MSVNIIYIVYKTTNLINGKFYIGVHKEDGSNYLGSGKLIKSAIKKYGRENFIRETLQAFENEQNAYDFEKEIVNKELINDPLCYNLVEGGCNPPTGFGENNNFFGKKHSLETKDKISKSRSGKYLGLDHWNYGSDVLEGKYDDCCSLYKAGKTLKEISIIFDVGYVSVYNCLKKDNDCKMLLENNNPKNKLKLNNTQIKEVKQMNNEGLSLRQIGRCFGVNHHTIKKYLSKEI